MPPEDNGPIRFDEANKRHPELFALLYDIRERFVDWIDDGLVESPTTALGALRVSAAFRAWNLYKAVIPLLERDLWEEALILIRSLFELLLNMEYVELVEAQRESRARRFYFFEQLQNYHQTRAVYDYDVHSGRIPKNEQFIVQLDAKARKVFATFLEDENKEKPRWARSWCGKNVRELAEASSQPIRIWQYTVLYSYASCFVHPTPISVLSTSRHKGDGMNWEEFASKQLESDSHSLLLATSLLASFTLELMMRVGSVLPKFQLPIVLEFFARLYPLWALNHQSKAKLLKARIAVAV